MNKTEYKRIVGSYSHGKVPEKLIVEMMLHAILRKNPIFDSDVMEEVIQTAAINIDIFYKTEVMK